MDNGAECKNIENSNECPSLLDLPLDVTFDIGEYLDFTTVTKLATTSKTMNDLAWRFVSKLFIKNKHIPVKRRLIDIRYLSIEKTADFLNLQALTKLRGLELRSRLHFRTNNPSMHASVILICVNNDEAITIMLMFKDVDRGSDPILVGTLATQLESLSIQCNNNEELFNDEIWQSLINLKELNVTVCNNVLAMKRGHEKTFKFLEKLPQLTKLTKLSIGVDMGELHLEGQNLVALAQLTNLKELNFTKLNATAENWDFLLTMVNLESLEYCVNNLAESVMLDGSNLTRLTRVTTVTSTPLYLPSLEYLQNLVISENAVMGYDDIAELQSLTSLELRSGLFRNPMDLAGLENLVSIVLRPQKSTLSQEQEHQGLLRALGLLSKKNLRLVTIGKFFSPKNFYYLVSQMRGIDLLRVESLGIFGTRPQSDIDSLPFAVMVYSNEL